MKSKPGVNTVCKGECMRHCRRDQCRCWASSRVRNKCGILCWAGFASSSGPLIGLLILLAGVSQSRLVPNNHQEWSEVQDLQRRGSARALLVVCETGHFLRAAVTRQLRMVGGWYLLSVTVSLCRESVWCRFWKISFFRSTCRYQLSDWQWQLDGNTLGSCAFEIPPEFQAFADLHR